MSRGNTVHCWQMIWIWKDQRVMKTIWNAHQGPVFDIDVDGWSAISGGEDMKLCVWNFAKDFRLVPPGEFARGEMLVKEIDVLPPFHLPSAAIYVFVFFQFECAHT